jgi:serine phosphatase RsbU (regulator of sigma subunit)
MLKARGFSLSTKFILFAVTLELILITGGLFTAYSYLSHQRLQEAQTLMQAELELISKQLELDQAIAPKVRIRELDLSPGYHYQVLDWNGRVYFDSANPGRVHRQIQAPHPLLELAKQSPKERGLQEFPAPQTNELFFGAFRKQADRFLVLGAIPLAGIEHDVWKMLEKFLMLSVLFSGLSFLMIVVFSIQMIRPIRRLTDAARELSNGNFDVHIDPPASGDEIGVLAQSFSLMAERVQDLLKEEIQKIRIEKEVLSVADIQQSLLPEDSIQNPRFLLEGFYRSATETGGDYWGYFETDKYLVMYVADATGHGLPSAMLTASARGCFSAIHRFAIENPALPLRPSQLLRLANEAVLDSAQEELNMTMFVVVYELDTQVLHYANAAHYPAIVLRQGPDGPKLEQLQGTGPRLGESIDFQSPTDKQTTFGDGDILYLYTDGLIDCLNPENQSFGKARLKETLLASVADTQELGEIKERLIRKIDEFMSGQPLTDDITFAFMKRVAEEHASGPVAEPVIAEFVADAEPAPVEPAPSPFDDISNEPTRPDLEARIVIRPMPVEPATPAASPAPAPGYGNLKLEITRTSITRPDAEPPSDTDDRTQMIDPEDDKS